MKKQDNSKHKLLDIKTELLVPYAKNARTHSPGQIEQVANSIIRFGFTNPILVQPDNTVVAGHCRLEAAKKIGLKEIPCIVLDKLTPEQCRALVIADNKLALNAGWDLQLLASELAELQKLDYNLDLIGFSEAEYAEILAGLPDLENSQNKKGGGDDGFDADAAAEEIKEPITKRGDIWRLGTHRLMCGDSVETADFDKLMNGVKVDLVFTDPPYNVAFNGRSGKFSVMKNDKLPDSKFKVFIDKFLEQLKKIKPRAYYICCNWAFYGLLEIKLKPKNCIVWAKNVFGLGKGYRHQHEFILFNGFIDNEITNETDLWQIKKDVNYTHPTQKPIELAARAINNSSKENDIVLDPFGGSGSTLIACEQLNRKCYMMELDPIYCDVIIKRWEQLTGGKAELCKTPKQKSKH